MGLHGLEQGYLYLFFTFTMELVSSRNSSVNRAMGYELYGRGSIPGMDKTLFCTKRHP
jgi:hypothetical protein